MTMAKWTVDEVGEWLKANGFGRYVKNFIDEDIDGAALIGLQDSDVLKLLSRSTDDGTVRKPTMRIQQKFQTLLEEYKTSVKEERKKNRRNISSVPSSRSTLHIASETESYTKTYTVEPSNDSRKFLTSELICSNLRKYFRKQYNVKCHIPIQNQYDTKNVLQIKLVGAKENVKNVQKDLKVLFQTIHTKIFNDENKDKKIIRYSQNIYSDSALTILQKLFLDKNTFTVWQKTNVLSGYYIVHYLSGKHPFSISEDMMYQTLNNDIAYVKDIIIEHFDSIQPKFRQDLEKFFNDTKEQQRKHQTLAIIYCQYPAQTEMRISFFGLKKQVDLAKRQIKILINKHQMKTIRIGLDSNQRQYLLDNYAHALNNIELDYKDDHVKIRIRENLIDAPQYLIMKIKQLIQSMINKATSLVFQYIPNAFILQEKDYLQLKALAQNYNCIIDKIETETKKEFIVLPKGKETATSKYNIKESKQFYSSLSIPKILSISNNTIEIHKSYDLNADITILSTTTDANKENIDPEEGNNYYESENGKKILFIQWQLLHSHYDQKKIKELIKKFIVTCFEQIDINCLDTIKTIRFSTTDWEKYDNRKELIEGILQEIKFQLESERFSDHSWRILFVFDNEQIDFFNEFSQVVSSLQPDQNSYEQFLYPISTTTIVLKTVGNGNISKCEKTINNYIKEHFLATTKLNHPFDSQIWNQYMINAYYKFCFEKFVLPKFYRIENETISKQYLELIGPITAVNEARQKYRLMSEIERHRTVIDSEISESNDQLSTQKPDSNPSDSYNIILSCCSDDKILSRQFAQRLTDEGYLVALDYSDKSTSTLSSKLNKTDVIIICFSYNYSQNYNCMTTLVSINESKIRIIPILFTKTLLNQQDVWSQRVTTEELFYMAFKQEIKFKLKEDFDLDCDKLIIDLFQYTKPGAVGRTYSVYDHILDEDEQEEQNLDQPSLDSDFTVEQIREKERLYSQQIEQIVERNKIPEDELTDLIKSLKKLLKKYPNVVEPFEETDVDSTEEQNISSSEVSDEQSSENTEEESIDTSDYFNEFLFSLQRWLEKTADGPVMRGNLPPFTLTGDYNDAIFPISFENKTPWWTTTGDLVDFNHSNPKLCLLDPRLTIGSWCNYDETHRYYQKLIDKDIQFRQLKQQERSETIKEEEEEQEDSDTEEDKPTHLRRYPHFKTNLKKDIPAWHITQNREVLEEYERRNRKEKPKKSRRVLGWSSVTDFPTPKEYRFQWNKLMDKEVELISKIKMDKNIMKSDEVEGRIGKGLKTREKIRKRNELDDPNNPRWRNKKVYIGWQGDRDDIRQKRANLNPYIQEFIQMKIKNIIQWQQFCAAQK